MTRPVRWFERFPPWCLAVAVFLGCAVLCGPWGDYPLNDDWVYARIAGRLAETGTLVLDENAAAPGVGQAILAAPWLRLFGFSHALLRLTTLALACVGLWCVDRLLRFAGSQAAVRLAAMLVLALNPLYFYLSATYMTEIPSLVTMLLAAVAWFHGRGRSTPDGPALGTGSALLSGAIAGAAFWTRQNVLVWFAALLAATTLALALAGDWRRLRRSVLPFAVAAAGCALVAGAFLPWARATGNLTPAFAARLTAVHSFPWRAWEIQPLVAAAYLSFFMAPLLLLVRPRGARWVQASFCAALLIASCSGALFLAAQEGPEQSMQAWLRRSFPYLPNVLFNAGIGPVTFTEASRGDVATWPHWPLLAFRGVHGVAVVAGGLWALVVPRLGAFLRRGRREVEIFFLGAAGTVLSLAVTIQGRGMELFDRYHLPLVLGGVLAIGAFLAFDAGDRGAEGDGGAERARLPWPRFLIPWTVLTVFTVAGLHDHFAWNDARWTLVRGYIAEGGSPRRLQAGYEVNAWFNYDAWRRGERPPAVEGCCRCDPAAYDCFDDTFWIGMGLPSVPGYQVVRSIQPRYWLTPWARPVTLSRR
ncbi:MAG TPA: hypothetical protein VFC25_16320 [Verrucomicrobiae bacterium]|nr:hypothetical protein [Verrucomicrobiae bacterium]